MKQKILILGNIGIIFDLDRLLYWYNTLLYFDGEDLHGSKADIVIVEISKIVREKKYKISLKELHTRYFHEGTKCILTLSTESYLKKLHKEDHTFIHDHCITPKNNLPIQNAGIVYERINKYLTKKDL